MKNKIKELAKKSKHVTALYNRVVRNRKTEDVEKIINQYYPTQGKRIILIGHSGGMGGAETLLKNMMKEFVRQGIQIVTLVRGDGPIIASYKEIAPTFIIDTPEKNERYIKTLKKLGYHSAISNTMTTGDLIPLLHENGIYSVNLIHELPGVIRLLKCEERAREIAEHSDLAVFPAKYVRDQFATIAPIHVKEMIQPQGLYMKYDQYDYEKSRRYMEEKYGIPKDHFIVLNVGLGEKRKGFDLFVTMAEKLQEENYTFVWVGTLDQEMKASYGDRLHKLKNFVLPGFIGEKETFMKFYDACNVFALTSREDPFPSVVVEAFNAERPVIAFENAGGFQDIVRNDESGYLVDYEDTDAMVDKIKMLKDDPKLCKKLGKKAKKICDQHSFQHYIEVLEKACK